MPPVWWCSRRPRSASERENNINTLTINVQLRPCTKKKFVTRPCIGLHAKMKEKVARKTEDEHVNTKPSWRKRLAGETATPSWHPASLGPPACYPRPWPPNTSVWNQIWPAARKLNPTHSDTSKHCSNITSNLTSNKTHTHLLQSEIWGRERDAWDVSSG